MLDCDQYLMPATLDEALDLMERHKGRHRVIAGATDLLPATRQGRVGDIHVPVLIDIGGLESLKDVRLVGKRVRIGAATPIARFMDDPVLKEHLPIMLHCAVWFADDQLREAATLGGNLVNASPAADAMPPMIAMNGAVIMERLENGRRDRRALPIEEFVTGPGRTRLREGELVTAVECDSMAGYGGAFEKVGHRRSLVLSTVCLAALVKPDRDGRVFEDVRLALGAVGPVPCRLRDCEATLVGQPISRAVIEAAARLVPDRVQSRTRREYRAEVVANFLTRGVRDALAELGIGQDASEHAEKEVGYG